MKKSIKVGVIATVSAIVLTGCGFTQQRDLEEGELVNPDEAIVYANVDQHPNLVRLCIDGVSFVTTTREYGDAVLRVPEFDDHCTSVDQS